MDKNRKRFVFFSFCCLKQATKLHSSLKVSGRSQRGSVEAVVFGSSRRGLMPMNNLGAEFNFPRTRNISAALVVSPDDGSAASKQNLKKKDQKTICVYADDKMLLFCLHGWQRIRRRKCSSEAGEASQDRVGGPAGRWHTWQRRCCHCSHRAGSWQSGRSLSAQAKESGAGGGGGECVCAHTPPSSPHQATTTTITSTSWFNLTK